MMESYVKVVRVKDSRPKTARGLVRPAGLVEQRDELRSRPDERWPSWRAWQRRTGSSSLENFNPASVRRTSTTRRFPAGRSRRINMRCSEVVEHAGDVRCPRDEPFGQGQGRQPAG